MPVNTVKNMNEALLFTLEMMEDTNFDWYQVVKELSVTCPNEVFNAMNMVKNGTSSFVDEQVRQLILDNKFVSAVKYFREEHGVGLKEAKDHCERIRADLRVMGKMP